MERLGRYPSAIALYERFGAQNPKDQRAAEAFYRTAEIYRTVLKDAAEARRCYEQVLRNYPQSEWSNLAEQGIMLSPDYFPSALFRIMGDSQSGGNYMKTEESCDPDPKNPEKIKVKRKIFAGKNIVSEVSLAYEKKKLELREYPEKGGGYCVVLKYPLQKQLRWESARGSAKYSFLIEEDDLTVAVKAGVFSHCVKVKQQSASARSTWKVEYYAPDTGLILTAAATPNNETRIAELLSIKPASGTEAPKEKPFQSIQDWFEEKFGK